MAQVCAPQAEGERPYEPARLRDLADGEDVAGATAGGSEPEEALLGQRIGVRLGCTRVLESPHWNRFRPPHPPALDKS